MKETVSHFVFVLVAGNNTGKTSIAKKIAEETGWKHYSIRKQIEKTYEDVNRKAIPKVRSEFTSFSTKYKKEKGSEVFVKMVLDKFIKSNNRICIVESVRCTGEAKWLRELKTYFGRSWKVVLFHIDASREDRLEWFLRGRLEEIVKERTEKEFDEQEKNTNSGEEPWDENIAATSKYCHYKVMNGKEKFLEVIAEVIEIAKTEIRKTKPVVV